MVAPGATAASADRTRHVPLPAGLSWWTPPSTALASGQAGTHRLHFKLSQAGRDLAEGTQAFDVGDPVLLGIAVPQPYYRTTWPIEASAALSSNSATPASLNIMLDGQVIESRTVTRSGYGVEPLSLGTLAAGQHTLSASLIGSNGCTSRAETSITVVPLPGVEIVSTLPDGLNGWHVSTPTIYLRSDEVRSPIQGYYAWNDGVQRLYTGDPLDVPADGLQILSTWFVADDASSIPFVTKPLPIDRQPPQVTAEVAGQQVVTVTLVATDTTSGVDSIEYSVDGGAWQPYTTPLVFAPPKPLTVDYRARDRAGNWSPTGTVHLPCELYPIALNQDTVANAQAGQSLGDVFNGTGPGDFGWLSWAGNPNTPTLVLSLTPYGNSDTYINPNDAADHKLSIGDWVYGKPGVSNSSGVRAALDALKPLLIVVPVWDTATGQGSNLQYHIIDFARIQITDYQLPDQNRITATFHGIAYCP